MNRTICVLTISIFTILGTSKIASAVPIVISGGAYDLKFYVSSSVTLVPGVTGFIEGALENTGTLPITFKPWDATLSIGGYDPQRGNADGAGISSAGSQADEARRKRVIEPI